MTARQPKRLPCAQPTVGGYLKKTPLTDILDNKTSCGTIKTRKLMKLIIIFGPPAVGKMTVGQELEKITELKLFHNHMSLELVNKFFDFGTEQLERLDRLIRFGVFNEVANSNLEGLIFTYVWALNVKEDTDYIEKIAEIFASKGGQVYYFELKADLNERLIRNKDDHRLQCKPSKRDITFSEKSLLSFEKDYKMNTSDHDFSDKNIFTIDNTNLDANQVAEIIKQEIYN